MINADIFKSDKINQLTEFRIRLIVRYVISCYLQMLSENKKYSYSERGKIPQEDFLSDKLVNDYLRKPKNTSHFKNNISDNQSVHIIFNNGENMIYSDITTNENRKDEIDIAVWESGLHSIWSDIVDNEVKFAIECKRIENLSDAKEYVGDINKFCDRPFYCYKNRLPFEGQIAFIENKDITHTTLYKKINDILETHKTISTIGFLNPIVLSDKFDGTYLSKHKRKNNRNFSIYHLLFNYSDVIVD